MIEVFIWYRVGGFETTDSELFQRCAYCLSISDRGWTFRSLTMTTFDHFPNFTSNKADWRNLQIICWFTDFSSFEVSNNLHRFKENALSFSKMWKILVNFQRRTNFCEKYWQTLFLHTLTSVTSCWKLGLVGRPIDFQRMICNKSLWAEKIPRFLGSKIY